MERGLLPSVDAGAGLEFGFSFALGFLVLEGFGFAEREKPFIETLGVEAPEEVSRESLLGTILGGYMMFGGVAEPQSRRQQFLNSR